MSYIAAVLIGGAQEQLKNVNVKQFGNVNGWECVCHHMTMCMGEDAEYAKLINKRVVLLGDAIACTDKVMAIRIGESIVIGLDGMEVPSKNRVKHVTMYVNRNDGGKPKDSNDIPDEEWISLISHIPLAGTILRCE